MQNITIKAGVTAQYFVVMASVFYLEEKKNYEGILLVKEKEKEQARYGASEIKVWSKCKETVFKQLRQIAEMYPPKQDINILDVTGGV